MSKKSPGPGSLLKKRRRSAWLILVLFMVLWVLVLSGCATHEVGPVKDPPGFFHGLLHGFLILFSFIGSLFTDYEMYAIPNSGTWYNLGFLIGASIFLGGSGSGSRRCK